METVFVALGKLGQYSDVLRGELFLRLAEKYRLVVFTEMLDRAAAEEAHYLIRPNVTYVKTKLAYPNFWPRFDRHFRLPFIREYDRFPEARLFFYSNRKSSLDRFFIYLGSFLPKRSIRSTFCTQLEKIFVRPSEGFKKLAAEMKPVLLITSTFGLSLFEAEMVVFAKKLGIPTAAINLNYDNPSMMGKFCRKTDTLFVWNEVMKKEAMDFERYKEEELHVTGPLRFDHYFQNTPLRTREEFLMSKNLDPAKRLIVYATSTPVTYPPRKEFMQELIRMKREELFKGNPNILVRLHPHDVTLPYEEYFSEKGVHIERAGHVRLADNMTKGPKVEMEENDLQNQKETLRYADLVINFASTMTIEACIFDVPVINIGFPEWKREHYEYMCNKALLEMGGARLARSPEEMRTLANMYLEHPECDREKRKEVVNRYVFFTDGCAHRRAADFLDEIVEKSVRKSSKNDRVPTRI